MSSPTDCSVCAETFTTSVRTKICCGYCSYAACKTCVSRYLLSQVADAHCMNCRTGWNREFMDTNLSRTFCSGPWRDHKKKMLMNREKATLPNFQKFAAAKKRMKELEPSVTKSNIELLTLNTEIDDLSNRITNLTAALILADTESEIKFLEKQKKNIDIYSDLKMKHTLVRMANGRINNEYNLNESIYRNIGEKKETEKRAFIMKCVKEGCRGFLSSAYKCDLCSTYVCKDCMIEKNEKNDETHVCKKDDVESVTLIRKETKPCPKCGIRISKIDGCNQMWCTADNCGTAFDWTSGKVVSGIVHNPHYYEWVRRNNNGVIPRNIDDNPCGGFPAHATITQIFRTLGLASYAVYKNITFPLMKEVNMIYAMHRSFMDIENYRIPHYTQDRDPMIFKEIHISYLLGDTTEKEWLQSIFMKEHNIEKKSAVLDVLRTFLNAGTDIFRNIIAELRNLETKKNAKSTYIVTSEEFKPINDCMEQLEQLRSYINDCLLKTAELMATPVPQFDSAWIWEPIASSDKIKSRIKESKENVKV